MTSSSDMSLLPPDASRHPAYPSFLEVMEGRSYGPAALNQAWNFYRDGWKFARTPSVALRDLIDALVDSWDVDTAVPGAAGSAHGKPHGQSAVTALVVQDYVGGALLRGADVSGHGSIYWNLIPAVGEIDLTREQYRLDVAIPRGIEVTRSRVLEGERAIAARTLPRYELLAARVHRWFIGHRRSL